ncbi:MAG: hypothetical protein ACPIOQ_64860, partial [Promethearchaeia archaeon]
IQSKSIKMHLVQNRGNSWTCTVAGTGFDIQTQKVFWRVSGAEQARVTCRLRSSTRSSGQAPGSSPPG